MKRILLIAAFILLQIPAFTQNPKRELRAVWLTTHLSLDWPSMTATPASQQASLKTMLDNLQTLRINTIYFQVRGVGDAFYPSALVPWSNRLTGTNNYGVNPGWDPLAFAIEECHKRGMEIHAWLNPFRAATDATLISKYSSTHKAVTNPEWLLDQTGSSPLIKYFNPGIQAVRNHITDVIEEIVTNYDIDGIHFDDYFYNLGIGTQDQPQYNADKRGFANISDWRRDNITLLITQIGTKIKSIKPWVKFGISPSGIYRNFTVPGSSPAITTTGSEHYSVQFIDTKKWMEDGLIDYLTPQVYWAFSQTTANAKFNYVTDNWNSMNFTRHLFIGLATYKTKDGSGTAYTEDEIKNEMDYLKNNAPNVLGVAHFRAAFAVTSNTNTKNTMEYIRDNQYRSPALIPVMTWIDNVAPAEPTSLTSALESGKTKLSWTAPSSTLDKMQEVVRYAIYRSTSSTIDFDNSANLIAIIPSTETSYTDTKVTPGTGTSYYYAVRSLDRLSNESISSNPVADPLSPPLPIKLIDFTAKANGNRIKIEWTTTNEINNDYFLIEKAGPEGVFSMIDKKPSSATNYSDVKHYLTWDNTPLSGINYYRLTQFDKDGTSSKPEVTSAYFNELIVVNAKAFPNPTNNHINFSIANFNGKSIKARLVNLYGQTVHEEEFSTTSGNTDYRLGLKNKLPRGQYILSISDIGFQQKFKIIVL